MKKDYTEIIVVLDRSGSMEAIKADTIGGVNQFITDQQQVPGEARWTLAQFDDQYEVVSSGVPIKDARRLTTATYVPRSNTALYGAIGRTIDEAGRRLSAMPEAQRPGKVVFLIVTDGQENNSFHNEWSRAYTQERIKEMIQRQSRTYQWEFVYIGANQDAIFNAAAMGIDAGNALNYAANQVGTQALYAATSSNLRSFRVGGKADMSWTAKQKKEQEDASK